MCGLTEPLGTVSNIGVIKSVVLSCLIMWLKIEKRFTLNGLILYFILTSVPGGPGGPGGPCRKRENECRKHR